MANSVGAFFGGVVVAICFFMIAITAAVDSNRNYYWNVGYCTALDGEILSSDICAKDGQIIPIPPRP